MALISLRSLILTGVIAATLAACGSGREDPLVLAASGLAGVVRTDDAAPATTFTAASVPPELVAQVAGPLMLVEIPLAEGSLAMVPVGQNGGDRTWRGPNGLGLTFDAQGVMRASRGFGFDLMSSDVRQVSGLLAARQSGAVQRRMVHLDGEAQQVVRDYTCTLELGGREQVTIAGGARQLDRVSETCTGADGYVFRNTYLVDRSGGVVQSDQWISPRIGSVRATLLRD